MRRFLKQNVPVEKPRSEEIEGNKENKQTLVGQCNKSKPEDNWIVLGDEKYCKK